MNFALKNMISTYTNELFFMEKKTPQIHHLNQVVCHTNYGLAIYIRK
jgi:hypothetical protein